MSPGIIWCADFEFGIHLSFICVEIGSSGSYNTPRKNYIFKISCFWPPKMVRRGRKASHCILKTVRNVLVFKSRLWVAQMRSYRRSRIFGHFWVIDLTSQVTSWPRTLNSGVNGFVSWQATRWFLNRSSNSLRSQTRGGSYPPPLCREGWRNGLWCYGGSRVSIRSFETISFWHLTGTIAFFT